MTVATLYAGLKGKLVGDTGTVAWTVVFLNVMRIVNSAILTRLLTAEAFGVVGIITSVAVTFGLLSDIGIAAFMVRHKDSDDPRFIDELWTLRMIRSIVLTLGVAIASGPISDYLDKPELQWAIAAGGLIFLFDAIDSMAFFSALRNQMVKRLNKIDIINQVAGVLLSIAIAFLLRSYWAIMIANLLGQLFRAYLSYSMFPGSRRRWRFSKARAAELWSFSRFITGSTMLSLVIGQTDKVVLSKLFPLEMFGLYMLASNLAGAPAILASTYASRILYPRFAAMAREAPATIAKYFYDQRMQTTLLYAVMVGGVFACAPLIVTLIYDDRYLPAIFYLRVLLVSSFFIINNFATNEVMIAIGQQKFTLQANIVRLIYLVVGGFIGYRTGGPTGLVIVVGAIEAAAQLFSWFCLFRQRILDVPKEALILVAGTVGLVLGYGANLAGLGLLRMWAIG